MRNTGNALIVVGLLIFLFGFLPKLLGLNRSMRNTSEAKIPSKEAIKEDVSDIVKLISVSVILILVGIFI